MNEIWDMDNQLFNLVNELYSNNKQNQKEQFSKITSKNLINYALSAKVTADSEFRNQNNIYFKASQAVNCKWENWSVNMWYSDELISTHWLKVDLGQSREISKFIIRHNNVRGEITVDFKIQGSHNGKRWDNLIVITGNDSNTTTHDIIPTAYRYFRLYITYPGQNDFFARINNFEIWGVQE
jgi:F5/8 type C domain.